MITVDEALEISRENRDEQGNRFLIHVTSDLIEHLNFLIGIKVSQGKFKLKYRLPFDGFYDYHRIKNHYEGLGYEISRTDFLELTWITISWE